MKAYFIRRFLLIIPTFFGVTLLVFALTRFVPGGPLEKALMQGMMSTEGGQANTGGGSGVSGSMGAMSLSEGQIAQLAAYYGFDRPWYEAYVVWVGKLFQGDFGESTRYNQPVIDAIVSRLPISAYYGLMTLLLTYMVCLPLGIVKAIRHKTALDTISSVVVFVGYAIPGYIVGIGLLLLFAVNFEWFPLGEFVSNDFDELSVFGKVKDVLWHSALPLAAYVSGSFALLTFMMKNSLMENLAADYVRTAMAKGQTFRRTVFKHAFRNSLIPIATHFGNNISFIISGSFLIEKVFNIDGLGLLGYESLVERDYPVVMGVLVISSLLFLVGNVLSDLCVALVDPRVQFQ